MPMREIRKRFTFSEMALMAWRSKEMSANMARGRKKPDVIPTETQTRELPDYGLQHRPTAKPTVNVQETETSYQLPKDINNGVAIPKTFFDEEGELNLRQVSGPQALRYLNMLGLNIMPVFK
jgi:hypothetical protein